MRIDFPVFEGDGTHLNVSGIAMTKAAPNREVVATGVRNSVGLDFSPKDKTLWFTDNQVDGMGDDQPPGEINRLSKPGQDFGFPWYGGGKVRTNEYKNDTPPANVVFPEVEQAAHAADLAKGHPGAQARDNALDRSAEMAAEAGHGCVGIRVETLPP